MTYVYEINDLIDFLEKNKLTAEQFIYCLLLYNDKKYATVPGSHKISRPLSQLYKYHNNVNNFKKDMIQDLIDKGFVEKVGNSFAPDMLEITDNFVKQYFGSKYKFDQLHEIYPSTVDNFDHPSKPKIPLKIVRNYQQTVEMYNRFVKTQEMHDRVIDLVEWAKNNSNSVNLSINIENFVSSRYWEQLHELRYEEVQDNYEII